MRLNALSDEAGATIVGKLEAANPGGSVKDRIGLAMIEAAEKAGLITPGTTHARRADQRQHRHRPGDGRRRARLRDRPHHARDDERRAPQPAARLRRPAGAHAGRRGHEGRHRARPSRSPPKTPTRSCRSSSRTPPTPRSTAAPRRPEIWDDTDGAVDVFVAGVGHRRHDHRRRAGPQGAEARACASSPSSRPTRRCSPAAGRVRTSIQGIGAGFVPKVLDTAVYDEIIKVTTEQAFDAARALAADEGTPRRHLGRRQRARRLRGGAAQREPRQARRHRALRHRRALPLDPAVQRAGGRTRGGDRRMTPDRRPASALRAPPGHPRPGRGRAGEAGCRLGARRRRRRSRLAGALLPGGGRRRPPGRRRWRRRRALQPAAPDPAHDRRHRPAQGDERGREAPGAQPRGRGRRASPPPRRRQRGASSSPGYDVVVNAVDNYAARYLLNDACVLLGQDPGRGRHPALRRPGDDHRRRADRLLSLRLSRGAATTAACQPRPGRRLRPRAGRHRIAAGRPR